jgi:hypothetical protein
LTKCGKFGTKKISCRLDPTHTKKTEQKENSDKYEQWGSDVFKVECCGSSLVTFSRKSECEKKLLISKRNRKQKSAVKVVADGVYTAKSSKKNHLQGRKREQLALMAVYV